MVFSKHLFCNKNPVVWSFHRNLETVFFAWNTTIAPLYSSRFSSSAVHAPDAGYTTVMILRATARDLAFVWGTDDPSSKCESAVVRVGYYVIVDAVKTSGLVWRHKKNVSLYFHEYLLFVHLFCFSYSKSIRKSRENKLLKLPWKRKISVPKLSIYITPWKYVKWGFFKYEF